jgi:protein involved in sex pheromone biosynthesis
MLLLSGCVPQFEKEEEIVQEIADTEETAIVPKYKISDQYYRTVIPFKPSQSRGLVVYKLNNRIDIDEFETGLMRLAQDAFPSNEYLYQDGQYLESSVVADWLSRRLTDQELAAKKGKDKRNLGLNPPVVNVGTLKEQNEASPIYLSHILEQNYLIKNENGKAELGGVVIGLALNSVHYYNQEQGYPREYEIPDAEIEQKGKEMSDEIVRRLRQMKGLEKAPIVIGLFKQEAKSSVVPGSFFAVGEVGAKDNQVDKWSVVKEEHYVFPSSEALANYRDDATRMLNFKSDIDEYFPNYTGVIGKGFYRDEQLAELTIEIPMQFYGKAEVIGFTQYVTGLIMEHFQNYFTVRCYISSISGQEAIIIREAGKEEPYVHIYD